MAAPKIQIAPELVADGKRLYETTLTPLRDIAAMMGISLWTLQNRIAEWRWKRRRAVGVGVDIYRAVRGAAVATATAQTPAPDAGGPPSPQPSAATAVRIQTIVEGELRAVEHLLDLVRQAKPEDAESSSRTLAGVSRIVREIVAQHQPEEVTQIDDVETDPVPQDIDEFRRELARRIRGFIEARRHGAGRLSDQPKPELD